MGEALPALQAHFKYYGVEISTVTFNWFITIFIDAVPFEVRQKFVSVLLPRHEKFVEQTCMVVTRVCDLMSCVVTLSDIMLCD